MSGTRLAAGGGRIDRSRPITVTFDGVTYPAYVGDTLASALLANGVRTVARGIYSGRPRGVAGIGIEEPSAYVQVESGVGEPMVAATVVEAYDGLRASGLAGRGRLLDGPDEARHDHVHTHCDVLVVGAGDGGMATAVAHGGGRVLLCDAAPTLDDSTAREVAALPEARALSRTTVVGAYDHGYFVAVERRTDHLGVVSTTVARQRLWHIRAKQVVYATGVHERPYAFPDNDRPGVMLAGAAAVYARRYGVRAGDAALVAGAHDGALRSALDLADAGVRVALVVDARPDVGGDEVDRLRERGIEVRTGFAVCGTAPDTDGGVAAAHVAPVDASGTVVGDRETVACDLVAVSGGPDPSRGPQRGWGARPGTPAGAGTPTGDPNGVGAAPVALFAVRVPGDETAAERTFLDLQRDATLADVERAVAVGMRSPEHVKRYTTIGTGADQGRTSSTVTLGVLAELTGTPLADLAPTTRRPPYVPVSFALLAGRDRGGLADPERVTPMQPWHVTHEVPFEDVGQWKRPWYVPRDGEDIDTAVRRECRAVRESVGMMDASTLGKIELQGRDVGVFLDRMYTNMFSTLKVGRIRYGVMCHADGMVFDDGTTARLTEDRWLMSTTTGNAAAVLDWLEEWLSTEWPELDVRCTSVTDHWATIALAGPRSRDVLAALAPALDVSAEAFPFMSVREAEVADLPARVMRISFSGELAYEVNVPAWHGLGLWEAVLRAGEPYGITPYGTETMHVLRAEKGFPIVGQETDGTVTPQDLGMGWAVSKKKSFVGRRSYARDDNLRDDRRQLVGLLPDGDRVVAEGAQVVADPSAPMPVPMAGHVTSSYWSVPLDRPFALALVERGESRHGERLYAVDGVDAVPVIVTSPVFYDPEGERRDG
ncbi:MAG: ferredoxin [Streptosporangiales bacterium]|nr:ferredoxin [Streptosporangiales bacterium]